MLRKTLYILAIVSIFQLTSCLSLPDNSENSETKTKVDEKQAQSEVKEETEAKKGEENEATLSGSTTTNQQQTPENIEEKGAEEKEIEEEDWILHLKNKESSQNIVNMNDWIVYKNMDYNFEVKIPKDWEVKMNTATSGFFYSDKNIEFEDKNTPYKTDEWFDSCNIGIFDNHNNLSIDEWIKASNIYVEDGEGVHKGPEEKININEVEGLKIYEGGPNATLAVSKYFKNDKLKIIYRLGHFIAIDINERETFELYKSICNNIENTFELLN